jgi:transcription-repair coupling factor (superfamily II helicase)
MKQGKHDLLFVSDQQSSFYQSKRFLSVTIGSIQKQKDICKIKENQMVYAYSLTLIMLSERALSQ